MLSQIVIPALPAWLFSLASLAFSAYALLSSRGRENSKEFLEMKLAMRELSTELRNLKDEFHRSRLGQ